MQLRRAFHELFFHGHQHVNLFLAHGFPHHVRFAQAKACQHGSDPHYLFLVQDNTLYS